MIKRNKWKLIVSSLVILLPMFAGIIMWNSLPEFMPIHWGVDGNVDGIGGRGLAVFGLPLTMLALHLVGLFITMRDPGNRNQSSKAISIIYWITPAITLTVAGIMYLSATGKEVVAASWVAGLLGVNFLILGNYMPKYRRNSTMGIKIKWTLESEENWNATHRFAGKIWVACGLIFLACIPLAENVFIAVCLAVIVVTVAAPLIYSWRYHKKQISEGFKPEKPTIELTKRQKIFVTVICTAILIFCIAILFTGNIVVNFADESFTIEATYYSDLTVEYDVIKSVEYYDEFDQGVRTAGFGSPRLSMGKFKNDEFGYYTIYAYNSSESCVVIDTDRGILVLRGADEAETEQLYKKIYEEVERVDK